MAKSFRKFLYYVWKEILGLPEPTKRQYELAHFLETGQRKRFIQAFRGIGKSYIACAYIVWRLWKNCELKAMIVSANEYKATENAIFIKLLVDTIPELYELRGGTRDSVLAFDVRGCRPSPTPSVRAVGIGGQMTGGRSDILLPDDIEVPKNSETETMREKLDKQSQEFASIAKPNSEIIYLGTPQTEESIYRKLPAKGYQVRIWPARFPTAENLENYGPYLAPQITQELANEEGLGVAKGSTLGGSPVDPQRFDELVLQEKELEYARSGFTLQFMLDTRMSDAERYPLKIKDLICMDVNSEVAPVQVTWASGKDRAIDGMPNVGFDGDRYHEPMYVAKDFVKYTGSVLFIDPSGRGKDETSFAVTKFLNGMIFVTRWGGLKGGYSETTLKALALIAKEEKVNQIMVESNWGDGMYTSLLAPVLKVIYPCSLEEYKVTGQKEARIIDKLEPVMNGHRLVIDKGLVERDATEDKIRYSSLYQLSHLTRDRNSMKHDDRVDVLAEAVGYWTEQLDRDSQDGERQHKERLLAEELKKHQKNCLGRDPRPTKYASI